jgi:D-alanyl-D-alanine carboxypeptidase/D-alanyl-D-alanine-endopeptidase (penicillin-binding protein 4)
MYKSYLTFLFGIFFLSACVNTSRLNHKFLKGIRKDTSLRSAHYGIAVWDMNKMEYVIRHQSDRYFVPASNVKIATLYTALKYLPDTLPSFEFYQTPDTFFIIPKGNPTFLDADFRNQKEIELLKREGKPVVILPAKWETEIYGKGWAWDDYGTSSMPEKSPMPVYKKNTIHAPSGTQIILPSVQDIYDSVASILSDTLGVPVIVSKEDRRFNTNPQTLYSVSRDSVCKKMMFDSDNLIAEQLMLMASNMLFGSMNEKKIIEKLLSDSTMAFPQKPIWVDGSGLSRYNLFTPEDMVYLLQKLDNEFGSDRIKKIFPSGYKGTLKGYYDDKDGFIYAKTGTLSGQISLSGFLTTKKKTTMIFSIMINNHTGKSSQIRKKVAEYIDWIWRSY